MDFLALAVLYAQFVVAAAARRAVALEQGAGLVGRQFVGRQVLGVVQATTDQRLVRVAFEEVHQHLHADARDGHGAQGVAGPAAGHAQPAAGLVVGLALAVPVELHLDPPVLVAVDFLAFRPGHHGDLGTQHLKVGNGIARADTVRALIGHTLTSALALTYQVLYCCYNRYAGGLTWGS